MEKMNQIQKVTYRLMSFYIRLIHQKGKEIKSYTNYIHYFVEERAISMSALPAPVIGNRGPVYNIPKVQCRLNPDASDSLTTKRQDTTTVNVMGSCFLFVILDSVIYNILYKIIQRKCLSLSMLYHTGQCYVTYWK